MDTATKPWIDAAKIAFKRVVRQQKQQEIWLETKKTDKITSVGKTKSKVKEDETNKRKEIDIPPEKRQQGIDDLRFF